MRTDTARYLLCTLFYCRYQTNDSYVNLGLLRSWAARLCSVVGLWYCEDGTCDCCNKSCSCPKRQMKCTWRLSKTVRTSGLWMRDYITEGMPLLLCTELCRVLLPQLFEKANARGGLLFIGDKAYLKCMAVISVENYRRQCILSTCRISSYS